MATFLGLGVTLHFQRANSGTGDSLAAEELLVAILRCALACDRPVRVPRRSTRRLIGRTEEFVECHLTESFRLCDVARAVGASPAYLTDAFRRFEGLPLYRYTLQSRLARALVELPHADDLTRLALDLGFSSHSHFAAAFRRVFGCTPSAFRASTRGRQQRRQAQLALQNDPSLTGPSFLSQIGEADMGHEPIAVRRAEVTDPSNVEMIARARKKIVWMCVESGGPPND